jgi:hypothetical protein
MLVFWSCFCWWGQMPSSSTAGANISTRRLGPRTVRYFFRAAGKRGASDGATGAALCSFRHAERGRRVFFFVRRCRVFPVAALAALRADRADRSRRKHQGAGSADFFRGGRLGRRQAGSGDAKGTRALCRRRRRRATTGPSALPRGNAAGRASTRGRPAPK